MAPGITKGLGAEGGRQRTLITDTAIISVFFWNQALTFNHNMAWLDVLHSET
jgi:hypothetical protein